MKINDSLANYISASKTELYELLKRLCQIPSPSHKEQNRAEFCKRWLEENGVKEVYIDEAFNVICPMNCRGSNKITVIAAHTDTVFPDLEPFEYIDDGDKIHCPGVGDDTAGVVVLMMTARYFAENDIYAPEGIMFVCNSCEEGLGNLKGTRQLFKDYDGRIENFISFDSVLDKIYDRCVGSHRYEVTVRTEGGHSLENFGNANALAELAKIISEIYRIKVPKIGKSITTYNVGVAFGGTSVNTIAQEAKMLCEYRSDNAQCLERMCEKFRQIFNEAATKNVEVEVEQIGDRPCDGDVDAEKLSRLTETCKAIIEEVIDKPVAIEASSTDCNVPLSLGIPAVAIGVCMGNGVHTREEWIEKTSLIQGLQIAIRIALNMAGYREKLS